MGTLWQDLRFGARMLLKKPGFTLIAVLTLALGIGANTAIFSVVNTVLLHTLPYPEPQRLMMLEQHLPQMGIYGAAASAAEFWDYVAGNQVFTHVAGVRTQSRSLTGSGEAQSLQIARVTPSLFAVLEVQPLHGRTFTPDEDRPGQANVAVLSHALWQRQFGADPQVIGRAIRLDEQPHTVIGVMPPQVQFPPQTSSFAEPVALWTPMAMTDAERQGRANSFDYRLIGRLKPGVSRTQARANMEAIAAQMQQAHPDIYRGNIQLAVSVVPLQERLVRGVRPLLLLLLAAVGLVLLIACANVASLLLARAAGRQKEMAVRSALGASATRLLRQLLTESVLLALSGGGLGLLLASWAVDLLVRFGPAEVPRLADVQLDPTALGFALLITLLTGVLFGLAPALQSARLDINQILNDAGGRASSGRASHRLRGLLVIFETAIAVVLLIGAGLLINSFLRLLRVPPGFNPEGVAVAQTAFNANRYPQAQAGQNTYRQIIERLRGLPGVEAVAVASNLPLTGEWQIGFRVEGGTESEFNRATNTWVSHEYFRAMGIELQQGRVFTDDDRIGTTPVTIVSEALARRFWPQGDALGKRLRWGDRDYLTIVGIVTDVYTSTPDAETMPDVYMPIFQMPRLRRDAIFIARTAADPASVIPALRREIKAADAELPVANVRTMTQIVSAAVAQRKFTMLLLTGFAAASLLLAAFGLYGVISYSVAQRTREIGLRMALGAQTGDVLKLVVKQGLTLTLAGVALGLLAAFALTRLMKNLLFSVSATDPLTFIGIALLLTLVAVLACWVPARRAARVDPMIALRCE